LAHLAIVDDDPAIHALLKVFFENLGHSVSCFENVNDASNYLLASANIVDLIVSDLRLPDGTGLNLLPLLKEHRLDLPLILITAYGSAEIAANALKQGVFDYITKPLNLTELEVICNRALHLRELEKSHQTMDKLFARHMTLRQLEKEYISHILHTTRAKKEEVAAILGIDRKTLYRKERDYNLN
jgi:DNA-binding NtrC family response regulator